MEYAHAVLALAENDRELSEANITAVLEAAGTEVTESRVKAFVAALEGVDIDAVNAQALAMSENEEREALPASDRDAMTEAVTTDAFMEDFSPAEPVDPDGERGGAFELESYSPHYPEDASESMEDEAAEASAEDEVESSEDDAAESTDDAAADGDPDDEGNAAADGEDVADADADEAAGDADPAEETGKAD